MLQCLVPVWLRLSGLLSMSKTSKKGGIVLELKAVVKTIKLLVSC